MNLIMLVNMNLIKLVNASVRFLIGSTLRATNQNRAQIFWANRNAQMDYPRARAAGYGAPALSNYCKGAGKQQNKNKGNAHAAGYGAPALSNYCKGGGKQQNKNP